MMIIHGAWGCKIRMNRWLQRLIDWLTGALSGVARLHSFVSCLLWDTGDWQNLRPLRFCLLRACFWAKNGLFQDFSNSNFFCDFVVFKHFRKMWKYNFFLVFWNFLKCENPSFFWISWFPMVGPKPTDTGPKGFLNFNHLQSILHLRVPMQLTTAGRTNIYFCVLLLLAVPESLLLDLHFKVVMPQKVCFLISISKYYSQKETLWSTNV